MQTAVDILQAVYSYTTTALSETPDDSFEILTGLRQGGLEPPLLYNLYMPSREATSQLRQIYGACKSVADQHSSYVATTCILLRRKYERKTDVSLT